MFDFFADSIPYRTGHGDESTDKSSREIEALPLDTDVYERARSFASTRDQISTSDIQRELRVRHGVAARVLLEMERNNIVSPANGTQPRRILTRE